MVTLKAQANASKELKNVSKAWEAKLREKLQASKEASQELEARVVEKDLAIAKERAWVTELETKLANVTPR